MFYDNLDKLTNRTPMEILTDTYCTDVIDEFGSCYDVFNILTKAERQALCKHLASLDFGINFDCSGDFIVARMHHRHEMKSYMSAQSSFCCGCYEETITTPHSKLLFSFSYGH